MVFKKGGRASSNVRSTAVTALVMECWEENLSPVQIQSFKQKVLECQIAQEKVRVSVTSSDGINWLRQKKMNFLFIIDCQVISFIASFNLFWKVYISSISLFTEFDKVFKIKLISSLDFLYKKKCKSNTCLLSYILKFLALITKDRL